MSERAAGWQGAEVFRFARHGFEPQTGRAELVYAFDGGEELVETLNFPYAPWPPEASRQAAFNRALALLHLVAGVSYYKAAVPARMAIECGEIDASTAAFLDELYVDGLAEFAFRNGIDLASKVRFSTLAGALPDDEAAAPELVLPRRALVAMGGGKDSLVALSMLQERQVEVQPVAVGRAPLIEETVKAAGLPLLQIDRQLAPQLAEMNRQGALNGHVPVTAINSAILVCAAILYGYAWVVFANERSADEATLTGVGRRPVNHQYSKSSMFEASFRRVIGRHVSPDIEYFSILRPYSELDVARRFSSLHPFHHVFSSCNRNFHLDGRRVAQRWCGDCPKCRFAALALAVFLSPEQVAAIQGADLLDDPAQVDGFRALCRLGHDKPFECVGEIGESRAALSALAADPKWRNHEVVRALAAELDAVEVPSMSDLLRPSGRHFIPRALAPNGLAADA